MTYRLTIKEFVNWEFNFYTSGNSRTFRLGQAFLNDYGKTVLEHLESDPILYYETNTDKARDLIYKKYVRINHEESV